MLASKKLTLGTITPSRTALAVLAATLLVGGSVTEASAKSRHHHHHHHSHHAANTSNGSTAGSWLNANAAIAPSSGSGRSFSGMASYYGNESGSKTASGQRFNQNAMTAAHRTLPFGTMATVTHLGNGRIVRVRITDRGPFKAGRCIDLSRAAANAIGMGGTARVTVRVE